MNISILLPYKENYSPEYPGAVSLFVSQTIRHSKYAKNIMVYGNTNFKSTLTNNYTNINLSQNSLLNVIKDRLTDG